MKCQKSKENICGGLEILSEIKMIINLGSHLLDDWYRFMHAKINLRICRIRCKEIIFPAFCNLFYCQMDFLQEDENGFGKSIDHKIKHSHLIAQWTKQNCVIFSYMHSQKATQATGALPQQGKWSPWLIPPLRLDITAAEKIYCRKCGRGNTSEITVCAQ